MVKPHFIFFLMGGCIGFGRIKVNTFVCVIIRYFMTIDKIKKKLDTVPEEIHIKITFIIIFYFV